MKVFFGRLIHRVLSVLLLILIKSFLLNRIQRVLLNVQTSSWKNVLAGVPQGSIFGPFSSLYK